MSENNLMDIICGFKSIALIGLEKNVGKTTVLNYIIDKSRGKLRLGLTSIGRDGEDLDRVTQSHKPKIYIETGTYIATSKQCLFNGDITKEIIETTDINTPMGQVIIAKALSDGFVELGGPSINAHMSCVCKRLIGYGCDVVLIDGALSRKTTASPSVAEAAILSTGASLDRNINNVVEKTKFALELLSIKSEESSDALKKCEDIIASSRLGFILKNGKTITLNLLTSLDSEREVMKYLDKAEYVVIKGILSDKFLQSIMKASSTYRGVTFVVEDGTKVFLKNETLRRFEKRGGRLRTLKSINILCVTCNPKSSLGYEFDSEELLSTLRKNIIIPVFDVMGGV